MGTYTSGGSHTLAEHWNGVARRRIPTPNLGSFNILSAVASAAPATVRAVGTYNTGGPSPTLALHCC